MYDKDGCYCSLSLIDFRRRREWRFLEMMYVSDLLAMRSKAGGATTTVDEKRTTAMQTTINSN